MHQGTDNEETLSAMNDMARCLEGQGEPAGMMLVFHTMPLLSFFCGCQNSEMNHEKI